MIMPPHDTIYLSFFMLSRRGAKGAAPALLRAAYAVRNSVEYLLIIFRHIAVAHFLRHDAFFIAAHFFSRAFFFQPFLLICIACLLMLSFFPDVA